jgi:hypothetical protein
VGRFGRWQGPTEAEQLAAVSHYAKYANVVPVVGQASGPGAASSSAAASQDEEAAGAGGPSGRRDNTQTTGHNPSSSNNNSPGPNQQVNFKQQKRGPSGMPEPTGSDMSRTSLLGRPLKIETHNRDLRYRKKQNIIYNFLERPRGWKAAAYHFLL